MVSLRPRLAALAALLLLPRGRAGSLHLLFYLPVFHAARLLYSGHVAEGAVRLWHEPFYLFSILGMSALGWVFVLLCVRRLHDLGLSGWWLLLPLLAGMAAGSKRVFFYACLLLALVPGREGPNRFGPEPLRVADLWTALRLKLLARDFSKGRIGAAEFNAKRALLLRAGREV